MSTHNKKRSRKTGLPPGTMVHIGEKKGDAVKISVIDYSEADFKELDTHEVEACFPFRESPTVTWINVDGISRVDVLERLGACYNLHPLVMEDIVNANQRPKKEDYGDYLYIVLRMLVYNEQKKEIVSEQVSIVLGRSFVISFQEGLEGDAFNPVRERLRNSKGIIRTMGADYLAYSLLDAIVDNYFNILETVGEKIENLEDELVGNPTKKTLAELHNLKSEVIFLRKSIWPLRDVIGSLERRESPLITDAVILYLRDLYDHAVQIIDTIETFRDMLSSMLDIYLSSISNRTNEVMKVLTVIATIFMPLTFLAGVYGMNFRHMPELEWRWAYPAVWLVMIFTGGSMYLYFKRRKWF